MAESPDLLMGWAPGLGLLLLGVTLVGFWLLFQRIAILEKRLANTPGAREVQAEVESCVDAQLGERLDPPLQSVHQKLERVAPLTQELQALRETVEAQPAPALPEHLEPLRLRMDSFAQKLSTLETALEKLEARARADAAMDPTERALTISTRVIKRLAKEGFEHVKLLADVDSLDPHDEHKIPVEARRRGATFKGTLTLVDGQVKDSALQPCYEAFP